jgi:hypothetical protein
VKGSGADNRRARRRDAVTQAGEASAPSARPPARLAPEEARDLRARALRFALDSYEKRKAATGDGGADARNGSGLSIRDGEEDSMR